MPNIIIAKATGRKTREEERAELVGLESGYWRLNGNRKQQRPLRMETALHLVNLEPH